MRALSIKINKSVANVRQKSPVGDALVIPARPEFDIFDINALVYVCRSEDYG